MSSGLSATLGERGGGRLCCRGARDAAGAQRRPDADGRRVGAARAAVSAHHHHVCARPTGPRLVWGHAAARCVLPLNREGLGYPTLPYTLGVMQRQACFAVPGLC